MYLGKIMELGWTGMKKRRNWDGLEKKEIME